LGVEVQEGLANLFEQKK